MKPEVGQVWIHHHEEGDLVLVSRATARDIYVVADQFFSKEINGEVTYTLSYTIANFKRHFIYIGELK